MASGLKWLACLWFPWGGGLKQSTAGQRYFFEEAPEIQAFRRWQDGDFLGVEKDFAAGWREGLAAQNLPEIVKAIQQDGQSPIKDLAQVLAAANYMAQRNGKRYQILKLSLASLGVPQQFHQKIISRWKAMGGPPLSEFAPYAHYIFVVDIFFLIAMAAGLIASTRPSHRIDVAYLYYLPFCQIFTSCDKLHKKIVPLFLDKDCQVFIDGNDLKKELAALAVHYDSLSAEERDKGAVTYAAYPPRNGDYLTSKLYDRFMSGWRKFANDPIEITPELNEKLMKHIAPMIDAIEDAKRKG